ncbi:CAP domain-containing protein [Indiicoccus explosivorum]|uniref:CAP domain-containing protein n=1 Tax=Indiicoccus explosivorum TaxID=1917864 RepID=UPI000B452ECA|nr:CAP-associated domain-containing protein [Indiicoccus explosivorum]
MKKVIRFTVAAAAVMLLLFIWDSPIQENETLQAPETIEPLPADQPSAGISSGTARPEEGVSSFIGKSSEEWLAEFGEPDRIEPSAFGYIWWVYNSPLDEFLMAGIEEGKVVQVYAAGESADVSPFTIGQSLEELYRFTIVESEIAAEYDGNVYTFHVAPEDLKSRILVKLGDVYAQLYLDQEDGILEAVRFMDARTLIAHRPYDMIYMGELQPRERPSSVLQPAVDAANARQILDLSNVYRIRHGAEPLEELPELSEIAREFSVKAAGTRLAANSEEPLSLADRLESAEIDYEKAAENTAMEYYDAAEAIHGWLNSEDHRKTLLSNDFTHTGAGAFNHFYTQEFIRQETSGEEPVEEPEEEPVSSVSAQP